MPVKSGQEINQRSCQSKNEINWSFLGHFFFLLNFSIERNYSADGSRGNLRAYAKKSEDGTKWAAHGKAPDLILT